MAFSILTHHIFHIILKWCSSRRVLWILYSREIRFDAFLIQKNEWSRRRRMWIKNNRRMDPFEFRASERAIQCDRYSLSMSTNEHLLKYQWPLEYLIWYWYWYDVVWNGRELYLDCYSQFIVTQKPWRYRCVWFYAFGYRNIHLISSPIRSFNWLIMHQVNEMLRTDLYGNGACDSFMHSFMISSSRVFGIVVMVVNPCLVTLNCDRILYAIRIRDHINSSAYARANKTALFIDVYSIICLRMEMSRLHQF